jgi:hypothetical protein
MRERTPAEARAFWGVGADHVLHDDGAPFDQHIGTYHIKYGELVHEDDVQPDFQVHNEDHDCVGHFHNQDMAHRVCALLSLYDQSVSQAIDGE